MNKIILLSVISVALLSSCARNYTCSCMDANGNYINTNMHGTKSSCNNQCANLGSNCSLK